MPRLAKQRIDYMIHAMKQYLTDSRSGADTAMTAAIFGLRDEDLAALAHWAAGIIGRHPKARFITLV